MSDAITYREAVIRALGDELEADERVILIGEDVGAAGGVFKATEGLHARFGGVRVRDTPIAEQAIVGTVLGAAVSGLRPVGEIMFADFAGVCYDQIVNQMAKYRFQSGGQTTVPATLRMAGGGSLGFGAQHSQCVENWFLQTPGLKLCLPATPADAYTLLRAAIRDDDPVIVFEHKALYGIRGELRDDGLPIGAAEVVREGGDVTVVATQLMRHRAMEAAEQLAAEGVSCEVIDPRTIAPLDTATILTSVGHTGRLVCVQEAPAAGSWGQAVIATVAVAGFELLDAQPALIAADPIPVAYARTLEEATLPSVERIAAGIRSAIDA
ncbi:MAG TPA: alpha-ketoacid dehydrogenase subunit beta [Gaiellales bacterium]|nr:alpha-ketoacid dehydrogenase subunit beta [Gaiellales bacterium]